MTKKTWQVKAGSLKQPKVEEIVAVLLENRGLKGEQAVKEFLAPPDPYGIKPESLAIKRSGLKKAVKRLKRAVKDKDRIVIYGDYDADGICATAILWETLAGLGAEVLPFIPSREDHGYGLNKKGIDQILAEHQPSAGERQLLVVTVDNGIVAHQGIKYAQDQGVEVIVTDHHQPGKQLPSVQGVVHSTETSGSGVAWFLARAVWQAFGKSVRGFKVSNSLELAAIGTITDVMPMIGVNRSLVKFGLEELSRSQRPGIKALCDQAGILQKDVEAYHIGYIIGPRLNAMGRLEEALDSLRFLCTKDLDRANGLADRLSYINRQRQRLTRSTFEHAKKQAAGQAEKAKVLVVGHQSYNQGIIGLVAGKLVEEFYRPAIVIAQEKQFSKGSGRSIKAFNMVKALRRLADLFEDLGGHPMAAGFTIKTDKLEELKKKLNSLAEKEIKAKDLQPVVEADLELALKNVNWRLFYQLEKFAPFGLENPRPRFVSRGLRVVRARSVGRRGKHLKLTVESAEARFKAIAFNFGRLAKELAAGQEVDLCYSLSKNVWNNSKSLELKVKDILV